MGRSVNGQSPSMAAQRQAYCQMLLANITNGFDPQFGSNEAELTQPYGVEAVANALGDLACPLLMVISKLEPQARLLALNEW